MTRRAVGHGGNICSLAVDSSSLGAAAEKMELRSEVDGSPPAAASRPTLASHQSNSLPSTPYQRPRKRTSHSRSPSLGPTGLNSSPRSSHSDSNRSLPQLRRAGGGCKYETGMARARRRVPYSLGPEKLEAESHSLKTNLHPMEDGKLSGDMRELYDRLQPTPESEERRGRLVKKLENLLNDKWPGHSIQVHVFGSSGNMLGTTDSDVDICITTDCVELERVCALAELLASSGMERVVCVSSAKVPIVKCWDPDLQLACDMNVNNTVALENTELIRAYVSLDDRVRPLAMIIKHWTRRRILNDAALGGTLSSYTWICLIINFLQTRDPPILPALQQARGLQPRMLNGFNIAFNKELDPYSGFGAKNKDSLGELLFQFFRYYGHELDFEENVMSVRLGRTLPKRQKGWHQLQDNRLCVEEPFNIARNLGNTADDTSMRGIHLELRRAFGLISEGRLEACCENYEPPRDEGRTSDIFKLPVSRPVITQAPAPTTRALKNNARGGRHGSQFNRGSNTTGRRPSNPSTRGSAYLRNLPFQMTPQELQMQAQHQQHLLHDRLFQQYQYLQAQEQELRMQLAQQALLQGRLPSTVSYPQIAFPSYTTQDDSYEDDASSRASSVSRASMSAPIHQQRFAYTSSYLPSMYPNYPGVITNPPSPYLGSAVPVTRRDPRRSSVTQSSTSGSMRAHSQPPSANPVPGAFSQPFQSATTASGFAQAEEAPTAQPSATAQDRATSISAPTASFLRHSHRPAEYIGYYVGQSPTLSAYTGSVGISPIPSHVGLAIQNGGLSPKGFSQVVRSPFVPTTLQLDHLRSNPAPSISIRGRKPRSKSSVPDVAQSSASHGAEPLHNGPVSVDMMPPQLEKGQTAEESQERAEAMTFSATTSEDLTFDTPSSSDTRSQAGPEDSPSLSDKKGVAEDTVIDRANRRGPTQTHDYEEVHIGTQKQFGGISPVGGFSPNGAITSNSVLRNNLQNGGFIDHELAALHLGEQLSPVTEIRTPSPSRGIPGAAQKPARPKRSRSNSKSKVENSRPLAAAIALPEPIALTSKPNGQVSSSSGLGLLKSQQQNWQTPRSKKKRPKRTAKSENESELVNVSSGDATPIDDAMRKGG